MALLIIWASFACLAFAAIVLSRDPAPSPQQRWWAWAPLSLHAGWLSLAAWMALAIAALLVAQSVWLWARAGR